MFVKFIKYKMTYQKGINTFGCAMEKSVGDKAYKVIGENGSDMYSMYGISGKTNKVIGASVALFSGIVNTTSLEACNEYVENMYNEIVNSVDVTKEQKANLMCNLIVAAFHCRDIRNNGKGRRDQSRAMFLKLLSYFPNTMIALLPEWKEFGCWKDYNKLLEMNTEGKLGEVGGILVENIYTIYLEQLNVDRASYDMWVKESKEAKRKGNSFNKKCEISLASKWIGKEGRALDRKTKCAKQFARRLFPEEFKTDFRKAMKLFRRFYSPLQDVIKTTEKMMCARRFDEIKFQFVPGKCIFKEKKAFLYEKKIGSDLRGDNVKRLKCRDNFMHHLKKAVSGNGKIHGKTVYIHDMCRNVYTNWIHLSEGDKLTYEAQWLSHVRHFEKLIKETGCSLDNLCVLADFSASMVGNPMAGAMAVALIVATVSKGPFSNKFMSFESNPHWISLKYPKTQEAFQAITHTGSSGCKNNLGAYRHPLGIWDSKRANGNLTFCEMVGVCYTSPWGGNTDFVAAHDLILEVCLQHNCAPPERLIVASDMQFNIANKLAGTNKYLTLDKLVSGGWESKQRKYVSNMASYSYGSYGRKRYNWEDHDSILEQAYKSVGLIKPEIIYWNMRSTTSFVTTADKPNVQMLGGFSTNQLKLFLEKMELDPESGKVAVTPWDTCCKAWDHECYRSVRLIVQSIGEGIFKDYQLSAKDETDETNIS